MPHLIGSYANTVSLRLGTEGIRIQGWGWGWYGDRPGNVARTNVQYLVDRIFPGHQGPHRPNKERKGEVTIGLVDNLKFELLISGESLRETLRGPHLAQTSSARLGCCAI
ncbi:hypothetical protein JCM24511_09289 [Saitozyma sp. JCM 24511]|nr:hypothetical protein JCM24511_09289 [Saitozyma sp. JCM 24511]